MGWSYDNIDWTATACLAAWVQAVGSVAAIWSAIWIDRGSARRAELADVRAGQQKRDDRILAIMYCASSLRDVAKILEGAEITNGPIGVGDGAVRALDVSQRAIDYYVANAGEVGPDLMGVLAHAQKVLTDGRTALRANRFTSDHAIKAAAMAFRARAQDIADVLAEMRPHSPKITAMLAAAQARDVEQVR